MAQAANAVRHAPNAMIERRSSILVVPFLRSAVGGSRQFPGALNSTVQRRGRPRRPRAVPRAAKRLLVEAISKCEPSATLTPEDDPLRRTGHASTPSSLCCASNHQLDTSEWTLQRELPLS